LQFEKHRSDLKKLLLQTHRDRRRPQSRVLMYQIWIDDWLSAGYALMA
jgi:hypothetical protein